VKFASAGGSKFPVPPTESMWMKFFKDGKHQVDVGDGLNEGKWEFTKNKDSIFFTTDKGNKKSMKIDLLTSKKLDLTFAEGAGTVTMHMETK